MKRVASLERELEEARKERGNELAVPRPRWPPLGPLAPLTPLGIPVLRPAERAETKVRRGRQPPPSGDLVSDYVGRRELPVAGQVGIRNDPLLPEEAASPLRARCRRESGRTLEKCIPKGSLT